MPNFDVYTNNYNENYPYTGVIFGKDAPLLEVELNEMQEILTKKTRGSLSNLTPGLLYSEKVLVTKYDTNVNDRIQIDLGVCYILTKKGDVIKCPLKIQGNKYITYMSDQFNENALAVNISEMVYDGSDNIPDMSNYAGRLTNYIVDSRVGTLTTKRKAIIADATKCYRDPKTGDYFTDYTYTTPLPDDYIPLGYAYFFNKNLLSETLGVCSDTSATSAFCPEYCRPKVLDTMENLYKHYFVYEYFDTTMPNNRRVVLSKNPVTPLEADYDIDVYTPHSSSVDVKAYISNLRRYLECIHIPPYAKKFNLDGFSLSGTERSSASSTTKDTVYFKPHIEADRHASGSSTTQYSKFQNDFNIVVHTAPSKISITRNDGATLQSLENLYSICLASTYTYRGANAGTSSMNFTCKRSISFTEYSVKDVYDISQMTLT